MEIKLTVDRFENNNAVLITDEKKSIIWPKSKLPAGTKEGSVLFVLISDNKQIEKDKKEQAKNILNELLNAGEEK